MKNFLRRCIIIFFAMGILGGTMHASQSQAVKMPALNRENVKIQVSKNTTLNLKRATKKVKWKSSNKKIAVVKGVSGKKGQRVMVYGKKAGSCKIIASSEGRKYSCKLVVQKAGEKETKKPEDAKPEDEKPQDAANGVTQGAIGAYVSGVKATETSLDMEVTYYNGSADQRQRLIFGYSFSVDRWTDGEWIRVKPIEDMCFPAVACVLLTQKTQKLNYVIPQTAEPLTSGHYRINLFLNIGTDPYVPEDQWQGMITQLTNNLEFDLDIVATTAPVATPMLPVQTPTVATAPPYTEVPVPEPTINPDVPQGRIGARVSKVEHTESSIDVTMEVYNGLNTIGLSYGYAFTIEKQIDGKWVTVMPKEPLCFPCVAIIAMPQSKNEIVYSLETESPVTAGHYRLDTYVGAMADDSMVVPELELEMEFDIP